MTYRRIFLVSLVLLTVWAGFGCSALFEPDDHYLWVKDATATPCDHVVWRQVSPERFPGLCSGANALMADGVACAFSSCLVISVYSEQEAKKVWAGSLTLFEHEVRHLNGYVHP